MESLTIWIIGVLFTDALMSCYLTEEKFKKIKWYHTLPLWPGFLAIAIYEIWIEKKKD